MARNDSDVFYIPPNFIESGTVFGGMLKFRNVVEAGVLGILVGLPVLRLPFSLTAKIIILCLTALPLCIVAVIGISGESLSSFALNFLKFLRNRRVVGAEEQPREEKRVKIPRLKREKYTDPEEEYGIPERKPKKPRKEKPAPVEDEFPEEFGEPAQRPREKKSRKRPAREEPDDEEFGEPEPVHRKKGENSLYKRKKRPVKGEKSPKWGENSLFQRRTPTRKAEPPKQFQNPAAAYLPVEKIENGVVCTKDHKYVKILELNPVNFLLRSDSEKRGIIYAYTSFLKISPVRLHIKVLSKRADINRHLDSVRVAMEQEENEQCRALQEDMAGFLTGIGFREGVSRRFFLIFEYEPISANRRDNEESEAIAQLQAAVQTVRTYLHHCGNSLVEHDDENEFTASVFYSILNRRSSTLTPFSAHAREVVQSYAGEDLPVTELFAPPTIDFSHGKYVIMDGVYHSYLLIPSQGYRPKVTPGWLSTLVNAGEGIDVDIFLSRQPKDRISQKLGQQLRINHSKIKDTSDTNSDFDDLEDAIRSGYFLKEGLSNNEDFYYMSILITMTAENPEDLEWRVSELKKLMISQDMDVQTCSFRQEQAFLSALPVMGLDKALLERSKRNLLTSGAASAYPFTSYEVCDDDGILLGVNKFNSSLVIVDIFNSELYKNANMVLMGTSGAGKTFLLQLIALRLREQGTQVFIIAPLKGHEYHRACTKVGGSFIQISPASPNCINIMEIRRIDRSVNILLDGETVQRSELAAKIQSLHIFFSLLIPDMTYEERQLLDDALVKTYAGKGITHDNASLEDPERPGQYREMPILGDLYDILIQSPDTKRMANILNRLVNGSAKTFNQQTNVNLDNKYVVLDISEITGDLLTVGMYVALDYVWDKTKEDRTKKKAIALDEMWKLIGPGSSKMAAERVQEIFKIIRGYGGAAIGATQDLDDYFGLEDGKYGKAILNVSKTKIILNLEDEEAQRVQPILHLSDSEVMEITHFDRGNAFLSTNNNNLAVEVRASELEKSLITTDRRELEALLDAAREEQTPV